MEIGEKIILMDDVLLIHDNTKGAWEMLDVTNNVALKYHIEFGTPKCKVIKIGTGP